MTLRLVITDLDNTLYDWVTFFATSFRSMTAELSRLLAAPEDQLLDEFKVIHERYGTSEPPFAALELPTVQARYPGLTRREIKDRIDSALHAFSSARQKTLRLYDGVADSLHCLVDAGIVVVGHTEAIMQAGYYRIAKLGVDRFLRRLYVSHADVPEHPVPGRASELAPPPGYVVVAPPGTRKPNPKLLLDICAHEGFVPSEVLYVGDSLTRDIAMAREAGVLSAWAKYGTLYHRELWDILVRVTHWTHEDVVREERLRDLYGNVRPDHVLERFRDVLAVVGLVESSPSTDAADGTPRPSGT